MKRVRWLGIAGSGIAIAIPKGVCPLCIATSSALVSALGLSVGALQGVLAVMLAAGLVALFVQARHRGQYVAFMTSVAGSALVYAGWLASARAALYIGTGLLIAASIANLRSMSRKEHVQCH